MKKVLLAIDGMKPDKKAFHYAVQFCRRTKADLNVLQVVSPQNSGCDPEKTQKSKNPGRRYLEGSFMAAAFAEAGEYVTAEALMTEALRNLKQLLPESEKEGVRCHLTMKAGSFKHEIIRYLKEHRDVVLTIYDAHQRKGADTGFARKFGSVTQEIQKALSIPLVVIRDS